MSNTGVELETFTASERAYFDSRGETPVETEQVDAPDEEEEEAGETGGDEAPETEAKADDQDEEKEPEKPRKDQRVPLRKLQEEVNARRELEKRNQELQEQFARADERLRMLFQAQQPQEQPREEAAPDPKTDPIGFMEWQQSQLERVATEQRQQQEAYRQQAAVNQIDTAYKQSWARFAAEKPDALDAYGHYIAVTQRMLERRGFSGDALQQQVQNEERRVALQALQANVSPAEWIYEDARMMGYLPKEAKAAPEEAGKKAEADIERRAKAAAASKSLSTAGGTKASTPSAMDLANMSEEEFEEFRTRNPRAYRKLMGD